MGIKADTETAKAIRDHLKETVVTGLEISGDELIKTIRYLDKKIDEMKKAKKGVS